MKTQELKATPIPFLSHCLPLRLLAALTLLLLARPMFACDLPTVEPTVNPDVRTVSDANNAFAFKLYNELTKNKANMGQFFSPFSIFCALSMTSEGLAGKSLDDLRKGMGLPDEEALHSGLIGIGSSLTAKNLPYAMALANAMWPNASTKIKPDFIATIRSAYLGESKPLDFMKQPDASRKTINGWVSKMTHDRINDLLPVGSITSDTRMVLTNAIYFKGSWASEFDKTLTRQQPFMRDGQSAVQVPLMHKPADGIQMAYTEYNGTQVLEIPYKGDDLSMIVMLPKSGKIGQLESQLSASEWTKIRKSMTDHEVDLRLPKFKMALGGSIKPQLIAVGLGGLFEDGDFSRMFEQGGNYSVSDVLHKAFVEVNEEGTEAAAATAVVIVEESAHEPEEVIDFRADHPFLFMIQQRSTGNILFMGKVTDPSAALG
ncbi:MAG: serpin family protein [Bacteroidia bacterium]